MYSNDIGPLIENEAFYLSGFGYQYTGFRWGTSINTSPGTLNEGQVFTASVPAVPTLIEPVDSAVGLVDSVAFSWNTDCFN